MKKLMIAAAAMAAGVAMADVESANVVGYNTFTMAKGFNLCAVNFKNVGEKADIPIIDLFPGVGKGTQYAGLSYKTGLAGGSDYIMVSKGPGSTEYDMYYLHYNSKTAAKNYKWCNAAGGAALDEKTTIKDGDAFWFVKQGDGSINLTVSGEVELSASKAVTIKKGFNLLGSFFPAGFAPNDAPYTSEYWKDTVGVQGKAGLAGGADYFMVSKGPGSTEYDMYYFHYNSKTAAKNYKWCNAAGGAVAEGNILPVGRGMWFVRQGDTDITFDIKKQF